MCVHLGYYLLLGFIVELQKSEQNKTKQHKKNDQPNRKIHIAHVLVVFQLASWEKNTLFLPDRSCKPKTYGL